jgi:hypothetical protein
MYALVNHLSMSPLRSQESKVNEKERNKNKVETGIENDVKDISTKEEHTQKNKIKET